MIANLKKTGCGSVWLERLIWGQEAAGASPVTPIFPSKRRKRIMKYGSLAQSVEHLTFNQVVPGSIPGWLIYMRAWRNWQTH